MSTLTRPASRRRAPPDRRKQQGFVAVLVGIAMLAMVAITGLALDLGKLFVAKSELQNTADACALAAAQELTGANGNQLELAESAAITVGNRHKVLFQGYDVNLTTNNSVTFSTDNSSGSYVTRNGLSGTAALAMHYAKCTATRTNIPTWFIQVVNSLPGTAVNPQQVSAIAIATLKPSQMTCAIPAAICSSAMTPAPAVGTWLSAAIGPPGGQDLTGSFKWIDFSPPNGGAAELADQMKGGGACALPVEGVAVGQPGNISSIAKDYNTRFGIYQGALNENDAPPDYSGYAYTDVNWTTQKDAFNDFRTQRAIYAPYQTDAQTGLSTQGAIRNSNALRTSGQDRRLMIAPVVDCSAFSTGQTAPIVSWACVFLLHPINNNAGSGGSTGGGTGNGNGNGNGNGGTGGGNGGGNAGGNGNGNGHVSGGAAVNAAGTATAGSTRMYLEYRGDAKDATSPCATYGLPGGATNTGPLVATLVK